MREAKSMRGRNFMCLCVLLIWSSAALAQQAAPPAQPPAPPQAPAIETPVNPDMNKPSADASTGQMKTLEARHALRLKGQSTWDDGLASLRKAIATLDAEAKKSGLSIVEKPLAHFVDSDDLGFTYEVYQPLGAPVPAGLTLAPGVDAAQTPAGRAMMFTHESAYDEIDSAYEAITAWLDEKGLTATGKFVEEFQTLPEKSDDPGMKLTIYVFLK